MNPLWMGTSVCKLSTLVETSVYQNPLSNALCITLKQYRSGFIKEKHKSLEPEHNFNNPI